MGAARSRNRKRQVAGLSVAGVCTLAFAGLWVSAGQRSAVLELARPVAVGQVITAGDVRTVLVGAGNGVPLLAAARKATVVGSTVAESLPAGTLLTEQMLGSPSIPAGSVTVAVPVKEGEFPPRLGAGASVALYASGSTPSASSASTDGGSALARGVVLEVDPAQAADGSAVVTVQIPQSGAEAVAQAQAVDVVEFPAGADTAAAQSGGGN